MLQRHAWLQWRRVLAARHHLLSRLRILAGSSAASSNEQPQQLLHVQGPHILHLSRQRSLVLGCPLMQRSVLDEIMSLLYAVSPNVVPICNWTRRAPACLLLVHTSMVPGYHVGIIAIEHKQLRTGFLDWLATPNARQSSVLRIEGQKVFEA